MLNEEFIELHLNEDVRSLALRGGPSDIDLRWCLQQIEGHQLASKKLPLWAQKKGLWFPEHLSLEQCSSEQTALYKRQLVCRLLPKASDRERLFDLTGGYGVDFSFLAPLFEEALYLERQEKLCRIVSHNLPILGISNAQVLNGELSIDMNLPPCSLIFLDPARRDGLGRKTVSIEDCTPDVKALMPMLLRNSEFLMIKLSPMLDITQALAELGAVCEVHIVSLRNECKELLLVCSKAAKAGRAKFYCSNLETKQQSVCFDAPALQVKAEIEVSFDLVGKFLYEPNVSVLKAGGQNAVCELYKLRKLHPMSHLFVGQEAIEGFPGRRFRIIGLSDFSKQGLKTFLRDLKQANLTERNFPCSVQELRRRLKLKEGGEHYLFATTLHSGAHALLLCLKS